MLSSCVRQAWLTLGNLSVPLEDTSQGYLCTELNLGFPEVREVVTNRPDMNGDDDRTALFGKRAISANISALAGAGAQIDAIPQLFAPFMIPSARPVLHYVLDRPGAAERVLTVRGSGFSWPITGPFQRDIQLQWISSEPDAKDPIVQQAQAYAGSTSAPQPGRVYPLRFPRVYPVGGNTATTGTIVTVGDLAVRPRIQIWGPITAPRVTISPIATGQPTTTNIRFLPYFVVNAGHYVEIDTRTKTVNMDGNPQQSQVSALDWQNSTWPIVNPSPPAAGGARLSVTGGSTSVLSQAIAFWQDRYLT